VEHLLQTHKIINSVINDPIEITKDNKKIIENTKTKTRIRKKETNRD